MKENGFDFLEIGSQGYGRQRGTIGGAFDGGRSFDGEGRFTEKLQRGGEIGKGAMRAGKGAMDSLEAVGRRARFGETLGGCGVKGQSQEKGGSNG
jgi:hypothetical protein